MKNKFAIVIICFFILNISKIYAQAPGSTPPAGDPSYKLTVNGNAYVKSLLTAENLTVKQNLSLKGTFSVGGSLGIGIQNPLSTLHVNGDGRFDGNIVANTITVQSIQILGTSQPSTQSSSLTLGDNLFVNGSIGVGTTNTGEFKLSVNGKIRASDIIKVYPVTAWPDFVFASTYKLKPIEEVERYFKLNKHLPNIPSAKEVSTEGIDLGAMDGKLLEKIEELTLYMIELKNENKALRAEMSSVKNELRRVNQK